MVTNGYVSFDEWVELAQKYYPSKPSKTQTQSPDHGKKVSKAKSSSGIFRVFYYKTLAKWRYDYRKDGKLKALMEKDLISLEEKVKKNNLEWIILDEEKAKRSYEFNAQLNDKSHTNNH